MKSELSLQPPPSWIQLNVMYSSHFMDFVHYLLYYLNSSECTCKRWISLYVAQDPI